MKRTYFVLLILITTIIFSTCANDEITDAIILSLKIYNDPLVPLQVNNTWRYSRYEYAVVQLSGQTIFDDSDSTEFRQIITRPIVIDGKEYFKISFIPESVSSRLMLFKKEDTSIFLGWYNDEEEYFEEEYFFKFPIKDGDTYIYDNQYKDGSQVYTVTKTEITVIAGDFECFVFSTEVELGGELEGLLWEINFYISPGVGLVYMYMYCDDFGDLMPGTTGYIEIKEELLSYNFE